MSNSQEEQDKFVLDRLNYLRDGYFVEIGAWDGIHFSNTKMIETEYNWKGLLVECDTKITEKLKENRPNCNIDTRAVWAESGKYLSFKSSSRGMLSGLEGTLKHEKSLVLSGDFYNIETVSLDDLLNQHSCPQHINYISIDTEGSEYNILSTFSFNRTVDIFTIEHLNDKEKIYDIMQKHGYSPVRTFLIDQETAFIRKDLL